jgi:hypothetical protein
MNQQPDKLFSEKLKGYQRPVPSNAWSRVESGLNKKNTKGLFLKIAAAISFLAVATILLMLNLKRETTTEVANNKKTQPSIQESDKEPSKLQADNASAPEEKVEAKKFPLQEDTATKQTNRKREPGKNQKQKPQPVTAIEPNPSLASAEAEVNELPLVIEQENDAVRVQESETVVAVEDKQSRSAVTLVFSAEEVDSKYLDKKSLADATEEEKKTSTLKKLLDKAYDLKHNQDPFGELRQKKNEILALNFKNEKQRSQNR